MAEKLLSTLKIRDKVKLQINTLGDQKNREIYITELKKFLKNNYSKLSAESKKKIETNPLRILDSKDESDRNLFSRFPKIDKSRKKTLDEFKLSSIRDLEEYCLTKTYQQLLKTAIEKKYSSILIVQDTSNFHKNSIYLFQ